MPALFRLTQTHPHDPAIEAWFQSRPAEQANRARHYFQIMRQCGDEVREALHDGCPTACLGTAPFAYVAAFTHHINIGFFHGAALPDPAHLLHGEGKNMRHVKIDPAKIKLGQPTSEPALTQLIQSAWADIKSRVENG